MQFSWLCALVGTIESICTPENVWVGNRSAFWPPPRVTWDQVGLGTAQRTLAPWFTRRSSGPQASPCSGAPSYNGPCTKGKAVKWGSPTTRPSNWRRSSRLRNTSPRLRGSVWLRCCSSVRDRSAHWVPQPRLVSRAEETTVRCDLGTFCLYPTVGLILATAPDPSPLLPRSLGIWNGLWTCFLFCRSKPGFRIDALNGEDWNRYWHGSVSMEINVCIMLSKCGDLLWVVCKSHLKRLFNLFTLIKKANSPAEIQDELLRWH